MKRAPAPFVGFMLLAVTFLAGCTDETGGSSDGANDTAKLAFSLQHRMFYNDQLNTEASFTLLENGKFRFETTTGGFYLCSDAPAGTFNGSLDSAQATALIDAFRDMEDVCQEIDSCTRRGDRLNPDWSVLGWGQYSDQEYYVAGRPLPELLEKAVNLEDRFYDNPERALELSIVEQTPERLIMRARYQGHEPYPLLVSPQAFVLLANDSGLRRLTEGVAEVRMLGSGESTTFTLDRKQHQIRDGDILVYARLGERKLNPCAVVDAP